MRSTRYALWLALGYMTLAGVYIAISSALAAQSSRSVTELARIEVLKGTLFVLVTGFGVFLGSRLPAVIPDRPPVQGWRMVVAAARANT